MSDTLDLGPFIRDDDEGLFSRDINGTLVRLDAPTQSDYEKIVTVQIDGRKVTMPLAEPLKDAQGNIVLDVDGLTTPRYTTIFDAAVKAYEDHKKQKAKSSREIPAITDPAPEAKTEGVDWKEFPIPTLCHQPHMTPVAVCRMCVVQIYGQKRGKRAPERKLLPACQHQVKDGMEIYTSAMPGPDGDRVRRNIGVVAELLTGENLRLAPAPAPAQELEPFNELKTTAEKCGVTSSRFKTELMTPVTKRTDMKVDDSSPVFLVDRNACILCERCIRACSEVKNNNVIGRTGKGPTAKIGFDLDSPMGESSCVQCGECMVSCPTTAITFKPVAKVKPPPTAKNFEILSAAELTRDPLLEGVPPKFLLWQEGLVVRRRVTKGEVLFKQDQPGNTAFFLKSGKFEIVAWPPKQKASKWDGLLNLVKGAKPPPQPRVRLERTPEDIIVGEMSCLNGSPRTADLVAASDGEVWEVRRNVLDRIMRSPTQREMFEKIYRENALQSSLRNLEIFEGISSQDYDRCVEFLKPRVSFVRVSPGHQIFQQGDRADSLFLIRLGHVKISVSRYGKEATVFYQGPGTVLGEIGLLAFSESDSDKSVDELDQYLATTLLNSGGDLSKVLPPGRRSASCSALDHVEMARIGRGDFMELIRSFGSVRRRLIQLALSRIRNSTRFESNQMAWNARSEYVKQGLYQGQSILAIDLVSCTRCDECTKACTHQHGVESHGSFFPRLLRTGLRFGDYLVATSCRSCKDAYCMVGCPVDSIHRGRHQQIVIENHCIGCGLCSNNCPFGNIFMVENQYNLREVPDPDNPGQKQMVAQLKAAACDLCDSEGEEDDPTPRCVYACPHDAAKRMTGDELLKKVIGETSEKVKE